ncbi:hypothetical protein [Dactylosporangium sp. NPDC005555]|uniref:hypothetical protein n=1 Tax=Dactylosporangium sp. NPDC005555 TaxID=3154889 RepID=UPI0033A2858F
MNRVHYNSYSEARAHFKDLLDDAERGRVVTVQREHRGAAIVDRDRLRDLLSSLVPAKAETVAEGGGWSVFIPGLPIAADGATFDVAVDEMVDALREYAVDWQDRLLDAPNHAGNWGLVQLVGLSSDEQLRDWLVGPGR